MDRAAAELFLASLFVEPGPERNEGLKKAVEATSNWEGLLGALEGHGLLGLFQRNVHAAGIELPPTVTPVLQARAGHNRDEAQRSRLTLQQILRAAADEGLEVTLVGATGFVFGGAGKLDLNLRKPGELELLVRGSLRTAVRAGAEAGLLLDESAFPTWWYRGTGTGVPLAPSSSYMRHVRVRARLHHPSLLLTARQGEVLARRAHLEVEGCTAHVLDPLDRLLDLAVELATRAGEALLTPGRGALLAAAASSRHDLRLAWLFDLALEVERLHHKTPAAEMLQRAREWSAEPALRAALSCAQTGIGFSPSAREWSRAVALGLAKGAATEGSPLFRPDPIERLPQWLRPSEAFLARRARLKTPAPRALQLARARHYAEMLSQGAFALLGIPVALLQRRLQRSERRTSFAEAQTPQRLSAVSAAWKDAQKVEQQQALTPRTIALLPVEEGVKRLPDHYDG